jgi:hypothetical protein
LLESPFLVRHLETDGVHSNPKMPRTQGILNRKEIVTMQRTIQESRKNAPGVNFQRGRKQASQVGPAVTSAAPSQEETVAAQPSHIVATEDDVIDGNLALAIRRIESFTGEKGTLNLQGQIVIDNDHAYALTLVPDPSFVPSTEPTARQKAQSVSDALSQAPKSQNGSFVPAARPKHAAIPAPAAAPAAAAPAAPVGEPAPATPVAPAPVATAPTPPDTQAPATPGTAAATPQAGN